MYWVWVCIVRVLCSVTQPNVTRMIPIGPHTSVMCRLIHYREGDDDDDDDVGDYDFHTQYCQE